MRSERCCCCRCCSVNDFDTTLITKESANVRERQQERVRESRSRRAPTQRRLLPRGFAAACVSVCVCFRESASQNVKLFSRSLSLFGSADVLALWLVLLPASASRALIPFHFIRSSASVNIPTWRFFSRHFARTTNAGFGNGFGLGLRLGLGSARPFITFEIRHYIKHTKREQRRDAARCRG